MAGSAHLASVSEVSFYSVLREEEVKSIDAGEVSFPGKGHVVDWSHLDHLDDKDFILEVHRLIVASVVPNYMVVESPFIQN